MVGYNSKQLVSAAEGYRYTGSAQKESKFTARASIDAVSRAEACVQSKKGRRASGCKTLAVLLFVKHTYKLRTQQTNGRATSSHRHRSPNGDRKCSPCRLNASSMMPEWNSITTT